MEHIQDAVILAWTDEKYTPLAKAQTELFFKHQRTDGQFPCYILDPKHKNASGYPSLVGYGQIQECVSFAYLCWEVYQLTSDADYLRRAYDACSAWANWLAENRMTRNRGLVETFCVYDTGHDNSARLDGVPNSCSDFEARNAPVDGPAPLLSPDINAVYYGNLSALSKMADKLMQQDEAKEWSLRAEAIQSNMLKLLYDEQDQFFYDMDRDDRLIPCLSIQISNVFSMHVLGQELFDIIYERHIKNPDEFWTPYPLPSIAVNDPLWSKKNSPTNNWGYFSITMTILRGVFWFDHYGRGEDFDELLGIWVDLLCKTQEPFPQEVDPITGEATPNTIWMSPAIVLFLYAVKRLNLK